MQKQRAGQGRFHQRQSGVALSGQDFDRGKGSIYRGSAKCQAQPESELPAQCSQATATSTASVSRILRRHASFTSQGSHCYDKNRQALCIQAQEASRQLPRFFVHCTEIRSERPRFGWHTSVVVRHRPSFQQLKRVFCEQILAYDGQSSIAADIPTATTAAARTSRSARCYCTLHSLCTTSAVSRYQSSLERHATGQHSHGEH